MGSKADAPATPNYGGITSDTLRAEIEQAPALWAASEEYQPKYTALAGREYNAFLNQITPNYVGTILPQMSAGAAATNTAARTANIGDIGALGPGAAAALRAYNPASAGLLDTLNTQAAEGLAAGTGMTADQQRMLNSSVRGAQGARGTGYGPAASYAEVLANSGFGQDLLSQRQNFAGQTMTANNAFYGDPASWMWGGGNEAFGSLGTLGSQAGQGVQGAGPSLFNPNAANDLWAGYYQSLGQTNAGNAAGSGAMWGGAMTGLGMLGAGAFM
jgi:hypothetical protein